MRKRIRRALTAEILGAVCLGLISVSVGFAQGGSSIRGTVTDATGAVIPGAAVTVTNQATGAKLALTTNSAGVYNATALFPGTYTVQVAAKGFRSYANRGLALSTDQVLRIDAVLEIGAETQTVTVEAAAPLVNTEQGRLSALVTGGEIQNMPLNGRNVFDLMLLVPGAVNSTSVDFEAGAGGTNTNINGTRLNFNGYLLDGTSNKGLSGGANALPSPDFVSEFRIQTNDFSAQYKSSAGSITDLSVKSGTNQFHGDLFEFFRNDKLNARNFFDGNSKAEWRMNQFGGTLGGPIRKDKLFFFGGYQGERFRTAVPSQVFIESTAFRQAVEQAFPNSTAALLYKSFRQIDPTSQTQTVDDIVNTNAANEFGAPVGGTYATGATLSDAYLNYLDPCWLVQPPDNGVGVGSNLYGNVNWGNPQTIANKMGSLLGVTSAENAQIATNIAAACPGMGLAAPAVQPGAISRTSVMEGFANASAATRTKGVFYDGDQYVVRGDYQGDTNRMFARFYYLDQHDPNTNPVNGIRGFPTPRGFTAPNATFGWVHTFSPTVVNDFHGGYNRDALSIIPSPKTFGVPQTSFDTGEPFFGAYNGYPQFFNENIYSFQDMATWVKGKHTMKLGGSYTWNQENSEFDVGRPSYYFFDPLYFSADLPYWEAAGVNPELTTGGSSHLDTNIRAFRNHEMGFFFEDDYKVTKNLTLNLGLRWDYFSPHTEKYGKATKFVLGPGSSPYQKLASVNCEAFVGTNCLFPAGDKQTPNGGFTTSPSLFPSRYGNFGPRFGFAWDPFGTGKNSVRGGFAISYEESFWNALSNSRWNLPFYSFNEACPICGINALPTYGPTNPDGSPNSSVAPTWSGAPSNPGGGPAGLGFAGNIMGWLPTNPNKAVLTGIPSPNYKFPYYEQFFLGVQHELSPSTVLEVDGVSTLGRHLFWAEDPNRVVGGQTNITNPCTGAAVASTPFINPCYGTMRTWETSVNSSYYALQVSLNRRFSRGLALTTNYTWSHSLDYRSTWHALSSGGSATDSNANGEAGYSLDPNALYLEKGNSLFDVRHRWVAALTWDLPWMKSQPGMVGKVLGGWTTNWNIGLQSGFPFTVGAHKDLNGDGIRSDRPDAPAFGNSKSFTNKSFELGSGPNGMSAMQALGTAGTASCSSPNGCLGVFPLPTPGTDGTLGRNTFTGPGIAETDFSLFKRIPLGANEQRYLQFRAEVFNLFNHTNLHPPVANLSSGQFGLATQAADPREIQFGLKMNF